MILNYVIAAGCMFMLAAAVLSMLFLAGWCISEFIGIFRK